MEFTDIFSLLPIFAGILGLLAFYKNGKVIKGIDGNILQYFKASFKK